MNFDAPRVIPGLEGLGPVVEPIMETVEVSTDASDNLEEQRRRLIGQEALISL